MPEEVQLTRLSQPRRHLLERPNCAVLIAAIIAEWTTSENLLSHLYGTALGRSDQAEDGTLETQYDLSALLAMRNTSSSPKRISLMSKKVVPNLPEDLGQEWELLAPRIEACARERNAIAHGDWWLSDKYPDGLILQDRDFRTFLYDLRSFEAILDDVAALSTAIVRFARQIGAASKQDVST